MSKAYKSEICAAIHETAEALYEHGIINEVTLKEFDDSCLVLSPLGEEVATPKSGTSEIEQSCHTI